MEIYLIRHGSPYSALEDPERKLNENGVEQCRRSALVLKGLNINFDHVVCSPKSRARQTAEILSGIIDFPLEDIDVLSALEPDASADEVISYLQTISAKKRVMLAGHLPSLSNIVSKLLCKDVSILVGFEPSSICRVDVEEVGVGYGVLRWLLNPEQIRLMSTNF